MMIIVNQTETEINTFLLTYNLNTFLKAGIESTKKSSSQWSIEFYTPILSTGMQKRDS